MKHFHLVSAVMLGCIAGPVSADQPLTGPYTILQVANGWIGEQFAIIVAGGASPCPGGPNEYTISATHPAYKEMVAMALSAFATDTKIFLRTDGTCVGNLRAGILELRPAK